MASTGDGAGHGTSVSHQVVRSRRKVLAILHADVNDPPGQLTRPTGG